MNFLLEFFVRAVVDDILKNHPEWRLEKLDLKLNEYLHIYNLYLEFAKDCEQYGTRVYLIHYSLVKKLFDKKYFEAFVKDLTEQLNGGLT